MLQIKNLMQKLSVILSLTFALIQSSFGQNKIFVNFNFRYNQTNINSNITNAFIFSSGIDGLDKGRYVIYNDLGVDLGIVKSVELNKSTLFNFNAAFQREKVQILHSYTSVGSFKLNNLGIGAILEKKVKLNSELKLGLGVGFLLNKSFKKNIPIYGSQNREIRTIGADTVINIYNQESLILQTKNFKLNPRFEASLYFRSGKHTFKLSTFFMFEIKKYNNLKYDWGYEDYLNNNTYTAPTYYTDNFKMKIFGLGIGYSL